MYKNLTIIALLGAAAILLGAFGAHALKESLSEAGLKSFETAVRYQIYHVIVLLFVVTYNGFTTKQRRIISYLFFLGILFFSGSIYLIQLTSITAKSIWFVTPLGGLCFVFGWVLMSIGFYRRNQQ
ncbi:MAG: DUF423 domain-containing protein [Flavobacteriaceae bacterium]|nr:DUF423 domain-containing protein [Flavobacteriaceae bacterium]